MQGAFVSCYVWSVGTLNFGLHSLLILSFIGSILVRHLKNKRIAFAARLILAYQFTANILSIRPPIKPIKLTELLFGIFWSVLLLFNGFTVS